MIQPVRQVGQRWDLEGLKEDHVDLNACKFLRWRRGFVIDVWTDIKDTLEGAEDDEVEDFKQALQRRKAENAEEVGLAL